MALRVQTTRRCRRTGLEPPNHQFSGIPSVKSFKIAVTLVVACGGMRCLLEWSLGAASDDHAALDGGLSARIRKRTAGNSCFSGLSSDPVVVISSLENGLSDSYIAKISRCAHLRTWGSAPPDQLTPSRTLTPVTLVGASPPRVQTRRFSVDLGASWRLQPSAHTASAASY